MSAKLIQVIQTEIYRGKGTTEDPGRTVVQFWSVDGKMLAEKDPEHEVPATRSQVDALMKNYELQRARADAAANVILNNQTLKPTHFQKVVSDFASRLRTDRAWRP